MGVKPRGRMMFFDPGGDAVEDAHADEGDEQVQPERLDLQGVLQAVQHQGAHFHPGRAGRRGRFLAGQDQEQHRREGGQPAVDQLHGGDGHGFRSGCGVSTMPRPVPTRLASVTRPTAVARSSIAEPLGRHLGPGVEQEGLGDGDADGAQQHQGVVVSRQPAQHAEDAHQHRPDADRQAEAVGIDHPGDRDRERDEGDHEGHRQQADLQVADAVELAAGPVIGA